MASLIDLEPVLSFEDLPRKPKCHSDASEHRPSTASFKLLLSAAVVGPAQMIQTG